jgi:hypothetical protein
MAPRDFPGREGNGVKRSLRFFVSILTSSF